MKTTEMLPLYGWKWGVMITENIERLQPRYQCILGVFRGLGMIVGQQGVLESGDIEQRFIQLAEVGFREALVVVQDGDLELRDLYHGC